MPALHPLQDDRGRAATRGADAASGAGQVRTGRTAAGRSRCRRARTCVAAGAAGRCRHRGDQLPEWRPGQVVTEDDIDPGQHDFGRAKAMLDLMQHLFDGKRASCPDPAGSRRRCRRSQPFCTAIKARAWFWGRGAHPQARSARASSFAVLATRPSTSGMAASWSRSISAAQPVTSKRASDWRGARGGSPDGSAARLRSSPRNCLSRRGRVPAPASRRSARFRKC